MTGFGQDVRFGLRQMRKAPGFTGMAVLTLALGIGAATAVFSLVDTVLLRPLEFVQPERLVSVQSLERARGTNGVATIPSDTSYPNFFDWRKRAKSFDGMASAHGGPFSFESGAGPARRLAGMFVTADFFRVLGVQPVLGRGFLRDEETAGNRSVILSHSLWQTAFHGDPGVIGRTLRLNDEAYGVVGVLPAEFQFPGYPEAELWVTSAATQEGKNPSGKQRGWTLLEVFGRLAPGVSVAQARVEMQGIQVSLAKEYPDDNKNALDVRVIPEAEKVTGEVQRPLHILFASVCLLLLIACANVAGLLLTRMAARRGELALRCALGATRLQIVRQLLVEALTLSMLGGLLGFGLAAAALRAAPRFLPVDLPRVNELALDSRIFLFALGASLLTGLMFGVLPAWRMAHVDPGDGLRDTNRSSMGRQRHRVHSVLVVVETAMGLVLLVGAGLLMRSFDRLTSVDTGFDANHLLTFRVAMPRTRYRDEKLTQFVEQLQTRLDAVPGVQKATYGLPLPLSGTDMRITFTIDGRPTAPGDEPSARASAVGWDFFETMKMPLRQGRFFNEVDNEAKSAPVLIVNEAFAERYFAGEKALGKRIRTDLAEEEVPPMREIVGVVGNVTRTSLSEAPMPEYYLPFAHASVNGPWFAVRVAGDPNGLVDTVRGIVAEQDASLPVFSAKPYTDLLTRSTAQQKFQTELIAAFAGMALLLAAIGLYGVLSYMVTQRRFELGLRMALGAQRGEVLGMIVRRGLVLCGAGLGVGLMASVGLSRFLTALLFRTAALDFATFASTTLLLLGICMAGCLIPAWRASRLDPNDTLRQQ